MRRLLIVVMLLLSTTEAVAEDQEPQQGTSGSSYFGAPVVKYTLVRDQGVVMFGGRGGWNVTPSLLIGGGAYGTMTEVDAPEGAMPDSLGPMDVKFETWSTPQTLGRRPT